MDIITQAKAAKAISHTIMNADTYDKNRILAQVIRELNDHTDAILEANEQDIRTALAHNMPENRIDRMKLNHKRINDIIVGINQVIALGDPIGEIMTLPDLQNGLKIAQMRVPLGVVGMIYEARPNVTVDAAVLCLKAGNAVFLRGSKDILQTNLVLVDCLKRACEACGYSRDLVQLSEDTTHESIRTFLHLHDYLDVIIPRGGATLIKECVNHASVPLIETGTGNCHIYVDKAGDLTKAVAIILNAKTQRTSVCNACESILLHQEIVDSFAPTLIAALKEHHVLIHGDETIHALDSSVLLANEEDYAKEYLALEISIKCVRDLEQAIQHINTVSTHHSDTIVTEDKQAIMRFLSEVDSACVYANASTRFSDGFVFGLGAEIGISTQKLHARGPMGLKALTSLKYIIQGNGQIRE